MGQIVFQATLGGQVAVAGPNTASSYTLTLPAATDTLVGKATTDTLTNKTLTSPTITGATLTTSAFNGTIGATTPSTAVVTSLTDSGLTSGRVTYAGASGLLSDSANFTWDNANARLGIAQGAPTQRLDVNGNVIIPLNNSYYLYTTDYGVGTGSGLEIFTGTADSIRFIRNGKAGTETMRITGTGNVGIGTSSPSATLHVKSSDNTNASVIVENLNNTNGILQFGSANTGYQILGGSYQGNMRINAPTGAPILLSIAGATQATLDSSGNLGLGVTPSAWTTANNVRALQMNAGSFWSFSTSALAMSQNSYYNGTNYIYSNTAQATQYVQISGAHQWFNAASGTAGNAISFTQAMTLDASSNLFVGKTTGSVTTLGSKVGGDGFFESVANQASSADGPQISVVNIASSVVNGYRFMSFRVNAAATQIGTITNNSSTGVLYNITSDYRLKTVIGSVTNAGQRIDALEPIEYDWNTGIRARGFLAHKFAEVYPNSVSGEKDAVDEEGKPIYQSMQASSTEVMADLIAEIQSLRQRITTLENK